MKYEWKPEMGSAVDAFNLVAPIAVDPVANPEPNLRTLLQWCAGWMENKSKLDGLDAAIVEKCKELHLDYKILRYPLAVIIPFMQNNGWDGVIEDLSRNNNGAKV